MKQTFKVGDKVKWEKRKQAYVIDYINGQEIGIVGKNQEIGYRVSPSELTKAPKRAVKKEPRVIRVPVDDTIEVGDEIDIPTNLRKVGIDYGHEDLVDSVAYLWASARNKKEVNNWPNGYTLAFVLAGILFVIAYCVGMARI